MKSLLRTAVWIVIALLFAFYTWQVARVGVEVREDFWDYWQANRFYGDIHAAFRHGIQVIDEARLLVRNTGKPDPLQTIEQPGPGLFDPPLNWRTFHGRWTHLRPVYSQLFDGWVSIYGRLEVDNPDGDYQIDYPPLRLAVMTLWTWKVRSEFPGLEGFPSGLTPLGNPFTHRRQVASPEIVHPLLMANMTCEAVSAIAMFFLVWIWVRKDQPPDTVLEPQSNWRARWGDPMLLAPVILLGIFSLLRSHVFYQPATFRLTASILDDRFSSPAWWFFLLLRFTAIVSLARFLPNPFRAPVCGLVAATLVWLNPASILDSFGWPQWDAWICPFFLIAAVLVSVDWWLTAGIVLAVGSMFKGQLMFISPVLILAPLLAGWMWRFTRITTGAAAAAGIVAWPWLMHDPHSRAYLACALFAAVLMSIIALFRRPISIEFRRMTGVTAAWIRRKRPTGFRQTPRLFWIALILSIATAVTLAMLVYRKQSPSLRPWTILLTLAIVVGPWFIPRRMIAGWLTLVFAGALWLSAASLHGSFTWWDVGFMYGTQKHQQMQLGQGSLSNLSSLLEQRYGWNLHDLVAEWQLPFSNSPIQLDVQTTLALLFAATLILCIAAVAMHLRRGDKKFLVALVAPWMLMVTLLTQMAARYMMFPAVVAAALVGVSVQMSLLYFLLTVLAWSALANQLLLQAPQTAPLTLSITRATFPDAAWLTLLLAAIFLVSALTPSAPWHRRRLAATIPPPADEPDSTNVPQNHVA